MHPTVAARGRVSSVYDGRTVDGMKYLRQDTRESEPSIVRLTHRSTDAHRLDGAVVEAARMSRAPRVPLPPCSTRSVQHPTGQASRQPFGFAAHQGKLAVNLLGLPHTRASAAHTVPVTGSSASNADPSTTNAI